MKKITLIVLMFLLSGTLPAQCLLVEVSPSHMDAFESQFTDLPYKKVGKVISNPVFKISEVEIPVDELVRAFNTPN